MEEKMTNKEVGSQLRSLRTKAKIAKVLTSVSGAVGVLCVWIGLIPVAIFFFVVCVVAGFRVEKNNSKVKQLLSDDVVSGVLKEALGDTVEYSPGGTISPGPMVFPFSYNCVEGSDHIKAVYHGLKIELGDISLCHESEFTDPADGHTEKQSLLYFKGQWLTCDFGKELAGEVYISECGKKDRKYIKNNIAMDNEQFSKRFCVTASNPQEAFYILTPHMMEYITAMADKSGGAVYMSFLRSGKMHVAVQTGRDFFELGKTNTDAETLRRKFLGELRWFTDIVDTLRVEDTIYKKEANE